MAEAVPFGAGGELPQRRVGGEAVSRHVFPGHFLDRITVERHGDRIGHERVEEPLSRGVVLAGAELAGGGAQLLADFDAEPDGVVPQHLARAALHHLGTHVQAREQRIERRGRGVHHEHFVEAAVLDPPRLAPDVVVADVNLARLAEARELLVRRLGGDDAGAVRPQPLQPHGEAAAEQRVELHEAGPGLVEQDVLAKMADAGQDRLRVVDGAVVAALLDDRGAERARATPGVTVGDQGVGADFFADARLVERVRVDRADQAVSVAVGLKEHRHPAGQEQRAVVRRLVVVALEQHQVALGDQRLQHDLVRRGGAVQHEIGALGAEDAGGRLLCRERRAFMDQQVAQLDHRVVDVVAEHRLAEMLLEDAADRAAVVERAAVVAGAGPELVALLGVVEQGAEEWGAQRVRVLAQAAGEVLGDELGRLLGQEDVAVGLVDDVDRQLLEPVVAHQDEDRHFEAASADQADQGGELALRPAPTPVDHDAADRGVGADHQLGVIGLARLDHHEAEPLALGHDLRQALPFEVVGVERRGADEELEPTLECHGWRSRRMEAA